jgi:hypothetical protein
MIDISPAETATIKFHYDDEYRRKVVEEQYPGDWIEVTIAVNDTYIHGGQDWGVTGLACFIVFQLLDSVEAALADEQYIVEFEYGPDWMVVEPWNETAVNVAKCTTLMGARNPEKRLEIDTSCPVTKQAWITEVIETAQNFHDTIIDLNTEIRDNNGIIEIQHTINRIENIMNDNDGDVEQT